MHLHARRHKAAQAHRLIDPQKHIVASAPLIVPHIVVEAEFSHLTRLQQGHGLIRPIHTHPAFWHGAFVDEEYLYSSNLTNIDLFPQINRRIESLHL